MRVGSRSTASKPALPRLARYWLSSRAPATHSDPELDASTDGSGHLSPHHDAGHREASARAQDAERLGEHPVLVGREVDDAVGDDHVHGVVEGNRLDFPLE